MNMNCKNEFCYPDSLPIFAVSHSLVSALAAQAKLHPPQL